MIQVDDLVCLPFFAGFSPAEVEQLLAIGRQRTFDEGQVVFGEALPDDCALFFAVKGAIRVSIAGKDHQQFVIGHAGEGTVFGEMSFVDGQVRSATITATAPLQTVTISRKTFMDFAAAEPAISLKIMTRLAHIISMRLRNADKFVMEAKTLLAAKPTFDTAPPPPPAKADPGKVSTTGLGTLDPDRQPDLFEKVEKLPQLQTAKPGGLQAKDVKNTPDVFHRGDPTHNSR
ncbi:MAG: cyclic nucleotide-binding domain-containing protein [Cyanobacteria bacterium REEB65]|nr:cyclic nucleotide-binding domain-containing protein [Cyanobacteria bacterium REEB65]